MNPIEHPSNWQRFLQVLKVNPQRAFGSYAAELSFYIIWAIIPLLLAFANVIAILPFSVDEILAVVEQGMPKEVADLLMPIIESYISNTSAGAIGVGLLISLWPASNVFNTVQRIMNTIFKAELRDNPIFARAFSYIFTLGLVVLIFAGGMVFTFGETAIDFVQDTFDISIPIVKDILASGSFVGMLAIFGLMFCLYYFMPNVNWKPRYAVIGATVSIGGFLLISQLFSLYMSFNKNIDSNSAIGLFIVVIIWLYYNMMVIAIGAYVAVLAHDYYERDYQELVAENRQDKSFTLESKGIS